MALKLLTEHHLEFLTLKGGCTGSSESTLVRMPHCWKTSVAAHIYHIHIIHLEIQNRFNRYQKKAFLLSCKCDNAISVLLNVYSVSALRLSNRLYI